MFSNQSGQSVVLNFKIEYIAEKADSQIVGTKTHRFVQGKLFAKKTCPKSLDLSRS